ncbi:MAG: 2-isopropylmalate synthase, partial [Desulfonatronovibrionaceae bacterium]
MSDKIFIFDTTLRDGEQSPGATMNTREKVRLARQLERLGVDVIEAGFPVASTGDFEAVQEIASAVEKCEVAGLCRCMPGDIERAWEAVKHAVRPRIHAFLATSDIHMEYKLNKSREEVLELTRSGVSLASSLCSNVEFSAEDASRSDPDFLVQVVQTAVDCGATVINIPDTVGYTLPEEFAGLIRHLRENVSGADQVVF